MPYVLNDNLWPGADYEVTLPRVTGAQIITLSGTGLGGTFLLSYRGAPTGPIPVNATAAQVRSALEVLSGLGVGNVTVTGSAGGPWTVTTHAPGVDPNVFIANLFSYNLTATTGTGVAMTVANEPQNTTGYIYSLQARSNAPLPATPNLQIDATHTTQGSFTNGGATGLVTLKILGSAIEALNFSYTDAPNNVAAAYLWLENNGTLTQLVVTGVYTLKPRVYQ